MKITTKELKKLVKETLDEMAPVDAQDFGPSEAAAIQRALEEFSSVRVSRDEAYDIVSALVTDHEVWEILKRERAALERNMSDY